ncbi:hypothetical protein [Rhodoplanes serenus]|jgi:hypothetical protein|uniref:hypothetical protein n=1 Tax=Rhodoplanes serenus TaxID=200615 RepID=UPI000DAE8BD4|nr:hypothetical protein [Rhodoplanes serenus]RAI35760.1 hypothetical protein CH340_05145 [Rhodoplanes serenus]
MRSTRFLAGADFDNLIAALDFAERTGRPLNRSVDLWWRGFDNPRLLTDDQRLRLVQQRISKWCLARGFELCWIWIRERGAASLNTHVLTHVPPENTAAFDAELIRALEHEGAIIAANAVMVKRAPGPRGKLKYLGKGMSPDDCAVRGIRHDPQGLVYGKRTGMTQNLNRAARARPRS